MAIQNLPLNITSISSLFSGLSVYEGLAVLEPLVIFVIGMVIYSVFVFKFYKFIARRDIFRISKGGSTSFAKKIAYLIEYIFLFPVIAFFWFLVISLLLVMLSQILTIGNIFMLSMAVMATIRITAYLSEDLSRDIAKLIPFSLLAVFLLEISNLSINAPLEVVRQLPSVGSTIIYYFVFIVVLEFFLRIIFHRKPKLPQKSSAI